MNEKKLDELHERIAENMAPHVAAQLRQIKGYDVPGNLTCERCRCKGARRNRQRTAYEDEESNWAILCPECQKEADAYWEDMWKEYYYSRF